MATKHDILTEEELLSYQLNPRVAEKLRAFLETYPDKSPGKVKILDWGCGRGRSVAILREQGFSAYGVEIDARIMANGFELFQKRGLQPTELLMPLSELVHFPDGFFDLIFSEQVFEHVADLTSLIKEQARLTAPAGVGIHCFPGSMAVMEDHLHMPFVHWLPKNGVRRLWIALSLWMGQGPRDPWPETEGRSFLGRVDVYYQYLKNKTFYRDTKLICAEFTRYGFDTELRVTDATSRLHRLLPGFLRRNGFPRGAVHLLLSRRSSVSC